MPAVPYFFLHADADVHFTFGVMERVEPTRRLMLAFNPVDPSLAIKASQNSEDQAFHLSFRGLVPYRPDLSPTAPGSISVTSFYGHAYATWDLPIPGIPVSWQGSATIDLDANDNGQWLGGIGVADALFAGALLSSPDVLRDINLGFNGTAVYGYRGALPDFDMRLGRASAAYNGARQGLWFKGKKGAENPWKNSPLAALEMSNEDVVEGTIFADGRFFLSAGSTFDMPGESDLELDISMSHQRFTADVGGSIKVSGSASIDNVGSASCSASAAANGSLEIGYSSGLNFSGSIDLSGRMRCYVNNHEVASARFDVGARISDDAISADLPFIGEFKVRWP
jgi:hypothetical protein